MAEVLLSEAERTFIIHGVQDNVRADGRCSEDYRHMELETDVVSNSNGSARIRLANTDVLVGIKAELSPPAPGRLDEGRLEFFVDCSANATPEFEGRGGEDLATEIGNMLSRAYDNPHCLDLRSLCVIPGQQCWALYIDVLLLECGGNVFDVASFAVKAALHNAKLPVVTVSEEEGGEMNLELSDDPFDCKRLDISHTPCLVTVSKIGHNHVVDATLEEEACCLARLMLGITTEGTLTAMKKEGSGSLDPDSVYEMMESGKKVGQAINVALLHKLTEEEKLGLTKRQKGFLR
ncbi:exosome complex exonuclease RRP42-like [Lingula anatina]|uniref:Exosome component 7 n=1 Tax=Lingula anatina TaxID=7574 RepID=A0A1S3K7K1_LINAN|nr:exosome complex exonuclease RRP42-like [Lingula anatina]|eukprot:XP_013418241.1 exosome complex exonuclease RRP42-like [Lingula anatina]